MTQVDVLPPKQHSNLFGANIVVITVVVCSVDRFNIIIGFAVQVTPSLVANEFYLLVILILIGQFMF